MNAARNAKTPHGFADEKCQKCNVPKIDNVKTCPTCGLDWGAPNVRAASRIEERTALKDRAKAVVRLAKKNQTIDGLERFSDKVQKDSHVVLALPSNLARSCFEDKSQLYANYHLLVDGEARLPAIPENDQRRTSVDGLLFGSNAKSIRFAALSLDGRGPSYGQVHFQLRDLTIRDRVSFLEWNSYDFVAQFKLTPFSKIPAGYSAIWEDRHLLAVAKFGAIVPKNIRNAEMPQLLLKTDNTSRANDDFIEAHIYGTFNAGAIEAVAFTSNKADKYVHTDIAFIKEACQKQGITVK